MAAKFGQILPGSLRAKFGQIRLLFVCHDEMQRLDLAKFCPQTSRQNLAKSSRDSLNNFGPPDEAAARFGQILPGSLPGKIWPNRAARRTR